MNRAFPEKNVGNSNNIETPVQLLEFMENFTQHPALVYRSAYTIFGTVTLWRFDALPATLESFKIWISDCTQRKVQLWPVIKNRPLLFFQAPWLGRQELGANWKQDCKSWGIYNLGFNIVSTLAQWDFNPHKMSLWGHGSTWVLSSFRYTFMHYFSYKIGLFFTFFHLKCTETF